MMPKQIYFILIAIMVTGVFCVSSHLFAHSAYASDDTAERVFSGPTQVVTVYFAGTLLKDDTLLQFNQPGETGLYGQSFVPELLQYLFHNQDDSDPNQHKIFVDGIGNDEMGFLDAGLAGQHANRCFQPDLPFSSRWQVDPWDPARYRPHFYSRNYGLLIGLHKAGFECWDFRLREAMDSGDHSAENPYVPQDQYTLDLLDILNDHPNSKIILNILGHSRGGVLAMMLAHTVSNLQRRYSSTGPLVPEHKRFEAINIITMDAVPGHFDRIGLHDEDGVFRASHEYFKLSAKVKNYVGFYAKDERQNIFQAVVPSYEHPYDETHPDGTRFWHLALNGGHQTMSGHPRGDGHTFEDGASGQYPWYLPRFDALWDKGTMAVNQVANIISQELLKSDEWGNVKFYKDWRSKGNVEGYTREDAENPNSIYHGSADCGSEEECKNHFMEQFSLQNDMDINTRIKIRSVAHPQWLSIIVPDGGLQGCVNKGLPAPYQYDVDVYHILTTGHYVQFGNPPDYFGNDPNVEKCTYLADSNTGDLYNVSLEDAINISNARYPDNAYPFNSKNYEACYKLVEMTDLGWNCDPDRDGDGISDSLDNCPMRANPDQADFDSDGEGNVCDANDIQALCVDVTKAADASCQVVAAVNGGSFDPDGDPVSLTQAPLGPYALGSTDVMLTVDDLPSLGPDDAPAMCMARVTVIDSTPPLISAISARPNVLWPPNHKMVNVAVKYNATDNCGKPACKISSVTSNEPINSSDYAIVDAHHIRLRAEREERDNHDEETRGDSYNHDEERRGFKRLGNNDDRIYTINITCGDAFSNSSTRAVTVSVPHDKGKDKDKHRDKDRDKHRGKDKEKK